MGVPWAWPAVHQLKQLAQLQRYKLNLHYAKLVQLTMRHSRIPMASKDLFGELKARLRPGLCIVDSFARMAVQWMFKFLRGLLASSSSRSTPCACQWSETAALVRSWGFRP